jgi:hypothetical protein
VWLWWRWHGLFIKIINNIIEFFCDLDSEMEVLQDLEGVWGLLPSDEGNVCLAVLTSGTAPV